MREPEPLYQFCGGQSIFSENREQSFCRSPMMIGDPFFYLIGILVGILIADLIGGASDDRHFFQPE